MSPVLGFVDFVQRVLSVELTPAQRVLALVFFDRWEPGDFEGADREIAAQLFGPIDSIPPTARGVVLLVKGARIGGSYIFGGLYALYRALTADLRTLARGEQATALVVAPDLRLARQVLRYALGAAKGVSSIERLIVSETSESFTLRRHDGHLVAVEVLPATRGGSALRGRSLVCAILSEASFFRDENAAINDLECFKAVAPRVLPGGCVVIESTPWSEAGLVWDEFSANWGSPKTCIAARAPTLLMRPDATTAEVVQREKLRDPVNAEREFFCQFLSGGFGSYLDHAAIKASVDESHPGIIVSDPRSLRAMCVDLAFAVNATAAAVVSEEGGGRFVLNQVLELLPKPGVPLKPSFVNREILVMARAHQIGRIVADGHYLATLREGMGSGGVQVAELPGGATGKEQQHELARKVINEERCRLPNNPRLLGQLRDIVARPKPGGGYSLSMPQRRDGSHGDMAAAVIGALWAVEWTRTRPRRGFDPETTRKLRLAGFVLPGDPLPDMS